MKFLNKIILFFVLNFQIVNMELFNNLRFYVDSTTNSPQKNQVLDNLIYDNVELHRELQENKIQIAKIQQKVEYLENIIYKLLNRHNESLTELNLSAAKVTENRTFSHKITNCSNDNHTNNEGFKKFLESLKSDILTEIKQQTKFLQNLKNVNNVDFISNNIPKTNSDLHNPTQNTTLHENCKDVLMKEKKVGTYIYTIKPNGTQQPFQVLCDMDIEGGGWTYIMNRFNGKQDFNLNWTDYKQGFGQLSGEFWLGLQHLHELTGSKTNELLFILSDWEGKTVKAHFKNFSIGNESENYKINVIDNYVGDIGKSFKNHVNRRFSTLDRPDPDHSSCVKKFHGGWWYGPGCYHVKLTGEYLQGKISTWATGIHYYEFHGYDYSLKEAKMMIRP